METSSLDSLDDDTLRSVLLRTPASDLKHICLTCTRFRSICDSDSFLQQRCNENFAEVEVLMEGTDLVAYDGDLSFMTPHDYGIFTYDVKIYVDKIHIGTAKLELVPLYHEFEFDDVTFHYITDSVSLSDVCETFFTELGKPTPVPSVQKAHKEYMNDIHLAADDEKNQLLYISNFKLNDLYRETYAGLTAARVLRKIVRHEKIKDKWTLAIYTSELQSEDSLTNKNDNELRDTIEAQLVKSMIPFFQAGFVPVEETEKMYAFCTPNFIMANLDKVSKEHKERIIPSIKAKERSIILEERRENRRRRKRVINMHIQQQSREQAEQATAHFLESMRKLRSYRS